MSQKRHCDNPNCDVIIDDSQKYFSVVVFADGMGSGMKDFHSVSCIVAVVDDDELTGTN